MVEEKNGGFDGGDLVVEETQWKRVGSGGKGLVWGSVVEIRRSWWNRKGGCLVWWWKKQPPFLLSSRGEREENRGFLLLFGPFLSHFSKSFDSAKYVETPRLIEIPT